MYFLYFKHLKKEHYAKCLDSLTGSVIQPCHSPCIPLAILENERRSKGHQIGIKRELIENKKSW
jgi:hypothetical protein